MSDFGPHSASSARGLRIVGHGPLHVVVAHGWIADHTLFDPFIALIDRERFTFAFPDCRGYGSRRDEAGPYTMDTVARDLLATADALGWRTFHLLGHSMGGLAAQRLMIDAPERLASALLLAPVPATGAQLSPARRERIRRAITEREARRSLIHENSGGMQTAPWVEHLLQLSLATTRPGALEAYLEAWSDTDFSHAIIPVSRPVLVLIGELDPGATRARMEETLLRWHPRAGLVNLPAVGHYPMRESPAALLAVVTRFISAATA